MDIAAGNYRGLTIKCATTAHRPTLSFFNTADSLAAYIQATGNSLVFGAMGTDYGGHTPRMTLTSTGLGIGTSSPGYKLDVNGEVAFSPNTAGKNTFYFTTNASNDASLFLKSDTTNKVNIQANGSSYFNGGNVGIGTTAPNGTLDINNGAAVFSNSGSYIGGIGRANGLIGGTTSELAITTSAAQGLLFGINNTERARIDSSGRLLVGTSSARANFFNATATTQLQIEKAGGGGGVSVVSDSAGDDPAILILAKSNNASLGGNTAVAVDNFLGTVAFHGNDGTEFVDAARISCYVDGTPGTNDMPGRLVFSTTADGASSPTERMRIHSAGNTSLSGGISVGGLGNPGTTIVFNGTVIGAGAGTYPLKWNSSTGVVTYDTSSALVKENIIDCPYGIDAIKQLQPRKYFRVDDQREEIGFVADEVATVLPEYVPIGPKSVITKDEDDTEEIPLGVHYDKLTAVLTKALQEAIAKIETLEAKVAALEAQ
jgi:hypothetical protein